MEFLSAINDILWHPIVLFTLLGVGVLFTVWTAFGQFRALTHGVAVVRGKYDKPDDPGAISHFQALSAALSATVGLGNIGGVALAIAIGGPGAIFWMWVVGFFGMAIKMSEVSMSMLYRNTDNPDNPHGGPMWVAKHGMKKWGLGWLGVTLGGIFCVTLLISAITGGNMFQAWNVGNLTQEYFGVDPVVTGVLLAVIVGAVILGGIKRIGSVAGKLVPFMCVLYVLMGLVVLTMKIDLIPEMIGLIFTSAFSPTEASGAFVGGTMGMAFMMGMKRALFSNEAGQGSAPIAHAAAKTNEPIREGVVAGLEPFIDTIVVCTLTALVIMVSGAWNRGPDGAYEADQVFMERADEGWQIRTPPLPDHATGAWESGNGEAFMLVDVPVEGEDGAKTMQRQRVSGSVEIQSGSEGDLYVVTWAPIESAEDAAPIIVDRGVYEELPGANLTSFAFDSVIPSSGKWIVTLAAWLFAISTMISWSYYGEQGIHFLLGTWAVFPYKMIFCALIIVSCMGFITTDAALDALTGLGTGVMLFANIPIMLIFGAITMKAYHAYMRKLRDGEFEKK